MEQAVISLTPAGIKSVCHASQYDIGRVIRFNLIDGGTPYTLDGTEAIKIVIRKPSGAVVERSVPNTVSTYVDWTTADGDCDEAGKCECEFVITKNSVVIGSRNFTLKVEADAYGADVIVETAGPAPIATFTTNIVDLLQSVKCGINAWSDSNVIEKEPYNFRKVAGTASRIGNHLFDKLVGGTVAWNQLVVNGNFVDTSNWGYANATASASNNENTITSTVETGQYNTTQRISFETNHKYFLTFGLYAHNTAWVNCSFSYKSKVSTSTNEQWLNMATICDGSLSSETPILIITVSGNATGSYIKLKNVMIFDLTAMFGTTIADYIYSLEQATAGAGVAWFRKLFPNSYYPYDAGSLKSVKTTAHKMVGKNLFDITNYYAIGSSITLGTNSIAFTNSNYDAVRYKIVLPKNTTLTFSYDLSITSGKGFLGVTDENNTPILSFTDNAGSITHTFNTGNAEYILIAFAGNGGTATGVFSNCQLEFGSQKTAYEPYTAHTYTLDDVELRGLFKLDSNNKLYADGDTYESSGDVTRKYGIVDLGTLNWYIDAQNRFVAELSDLKSASSGEGYSTGLLPSKFLTPDRTPITDRSKDNTIARYTGNHNLYVVCSSYSTAADFKAAMSGVYLLYEKETPTTETADQFINPQQVDANGTEEYIDSRTPAIPVGHETYYAQAYSECNVTANGTTHNIPFGELVVESAELDVTNGILKRHDDTTKQLTPLALEAVIGQNSVSCDTGDTEVKYLEQEA